MRDFMQGMIKLKINSQSVPAAKQMTDHYLGKYLN
jgi:hypothetical protein